MDSGTGGGRAKRETASASGGRISGSKERCLITASGAAAGISGGSPPTAGGEAACESLRGEKLSSAGAVIALPAGVSMRLGDWAQAAAPRDSKKFAAQAVSTTGRNLIQLGFRIWPDHRPCQYGRPYRRVSCHIPVVETHGSEILVPEISNIVLCRSWIDRRYLFKPIKLWPRYQSPTIPMSRKKNWFLLFRRPSTIRVFRHQ